MERGRYESIRCGMIRSEKPNKRRIRRGGCGVFSGCMLRLRTQEESTPVNVWERVSYNSLVIRLQQAAKWCCRIQIADTPDTF